MDCCCRRYFCYSVLGIHPFCIVHIFNRNTNNVSALRLPGKEMLLFRRTLYPAEPFQDLLPARFKCCLYCLPCPHFVTPSHFSFHLFPIFTKIGKISFLASGCNKFQIIHCEGSGQVLTHFLTRGQLTTLVPYFPPAWSYL